MITVACVRWGDRYGDHWIKRLRAMVAKHLTIEHEFVCLTDRPIEGVKCRGLEPGLPTWWSKLSLFKPAKFSGQVLYLDLDVVISESIDRLVHVAEADTSKLWARDDFSYSLRHPKAGLDASSRRYLGGVGCINSSVMCWHADAARAVWDTFTPAVMQEMHGDQNWISSVLWPVGKLGFLPDDLVGSYKYAARNDEPTRPVMVFHGTPKMDELPKAHELRRIWEAA